MPAGASIVRLASADAAARWLGVSVRGTLRCDSRQVGLGDGFIAWPGLATDGRRFVGRAFEAGAAACLVEAAGVEGFAFDDARVAALPGLKAAAGPIASQFFGHPSRRLQVLAATGTNGKTSTAWWTAQALTLLGRRCGLVGTLGVGTPPTPAQPDGDLQTTGLTTPDPVTLQAALRRFADAGLEACALEASSIGLAEQRLAGTRIEVALFTNFTRDHLDFHGSMDDYWAAKRALFAWPELRAAVLNIDDPQGAKLAGELGAGALDVWACSTQQSAARLRAGPLRYENGGLAFNVHEGADAQPLASTLIGDYNAANLLGVIGALRALGVPLADAVRVVPLLTPVPGRLQRVAVDGAEATGPSAGPPQAGPDPLGGSLAVPRERGAVMLPEVVVDYAHTPDALDKVLRALRPLAAARGGRLWCVFGCGGNRDATKRPLMGAIAQALADQVVVTSDNPRDERPGLILAQILAGVTGRDAVDVIEDRREAIALAVQGADARDVIVVAGKGHEDYQEVAGIRHPFSDAAVAAACLRQRAGSPA